MGLLVAIFVFFNFRRLMLLAGIVIIALLGRSYTESENRRFVADTWLRAIPGSYSPLPLPSLYSRLVEDANHLTVARLDSIVQWHQPDTVILLYDHLVQLPLIDSVGTALAGRPVLLIDAASGYQPDQGYQISNRRVADVLSTSKALVVGTPLQSAGPITYYMRELGYSRLRIKLTVNWQAEGPNQSEYAGVMHALD